ncbi:hypothetical protein [Celeribacter baekdonensis]|nr:hypothetical protein [Celeribacter baekdonensis]
MFHIFFDGKLIGRSALEEGDPAMGCAEGRFMPCEGFSEFLARVSPEQDNDPALKRWVGLTVFDHEGAQIECLDVVLFACEFDGERDLWVDALGIGFPLYEELFPGRYATYATRVDQIKDETH